jgi:hypothetical protein
MASKEKVLIRVSPMSAAKVFGVLYLLLGIVIGLIMGAVMTLSPKTSDNAWIFAVAAPLGYGLLGFLGTALAALLYNVTARMVGGLEMEVEG